MTESGTRDPAWHRWWRRIFGTLLVVAFVGGLLLSLRPGDFSDQPDQPDLAADDVESEKPRQTADPGDNGQEEGEGEQEPSEEPTEEATEVDEGLTEEEAQQLIEDARDPENTSVQVLDAGGGSTATSQVADTLRELGYDVIAINASRVSYSTTTTLYTDGNETEAQALHARDERFAETAPNELLSDAVDLHVVVGPDWSP